MYPLGAIQRKAVVGAVGDRYELEADRVAWRSAEGYRVFHIIRRGAAEIRGGEVSVQTTDGRRLSLEDFIAERRAAAAPAPAPVAP